MATVIKNDEYNFIQNPNKIDGFKIFTDNTRMSKGINPQNLNFDIRSLEPGQCSAPYHFHRHAEELFVIISGSAKLRTIQGIEIVNAGDIIFFEIGESGAHQLYNHTLEPCRFLDIRSYIGFDVCEYPDSNKLLIAPSFEVFKNGTPVSYFDGEEDIPQRWRNDWG